MAQFVGKDFLSRDSPPNYKPGIGRGAIGFSTSAERITDFSSNREGARRLPNQSGDWDINADEFANSERFKDADREVEEIYANAEKLAKRKKRRSKSSQRPHDRSVNHSPTNVSTELHQMSFQEWDNLPEASDLTHRHKRLKAEEQNRKRTYKVEQYLQSPDLSQVQPQQELMKRDLLQAMIRKQPTNSHGYIMLATLEERELRINAARRIAAKGCEKCVNEDLWLLNIRLNSQSYEEVTGARSRELAVDACKAIPNSTSLWEQRIQLEPTAILKLQAVHEALTHCSSHSPFWLMAADLEANDNVKRQVLRMALEFTKSSKIYSELSKLEVSDNRAAILAEARANFPQDREIWILSVEDDPQLSISALEFVEREYWLNSFLITCESTLALQLVEKLMLTDSEKHELAKKVNWVDTTPTEPAIVNLVSQDFSKIDSALQQFPFSVILWEILLKRGTIAKLESLLDQYDPPESVWKQVLAKLIEGGQSSDVMLRWLEKIKYKNEHIYVEYLKAKEAVKSEIMEALEIWPKNAKLYILLAQTSQNSEQVLRNALNKVDKPTLIWLELIKQEHSAVKKRAVLSQALSTNAACVELWLARIELEKSQGNLGEHLLMEALKHFPHNGALWVQRIEFAPKHQQKMWFSKALKESLMAVEVLQFGIKFFKSIGQHSTAEKWQKVLESKHNTK